MVNAFIILILALSLLIFFIFRENFLNNYVSFKKLKLSILETQKSIELLKCSCNVKKFEDVIILEPIEFPIGEYYILSFAIILVLITIFMCLMFFYLKGQLQKKIIISIIVLFDIRNFYFYFFYKLKLEVAQNIANSLNIELIELEQLAQTLQELAKTSAKVNAIWAATSCLLTVAATIILSVLAINYFCEFPKIPEIPVPTAYGKVLPLSEIEHVKIYLKFENDAERSIVFSKEEDVLQISEVYDLIDRSLIYWDAESISELTEQFIEYVSKIH